MDRYLGGLSFYWWSLAGWSMAIGSAVALVWVDRQSPWLGILLLLAVGLLLLTGMWLLWSGRGRRVPFRHFVSILLVVSILFPYLRFPGPIPSLRPEFVVVLIGWGLLLAVFLTKGRVRIRRFPVYKWFGAFAFSILLSMMYVIWSKGQPLVGRDFWELVKVLLYSLIFSFVASRDIGVADLKHYYVISLSALALSAAVGFLQYVNFAGINSTISPYYAPTQMDGLLRLGRITGTTPNPNEFGALMVLASSLALAGGLFCRHSKLKVFSWSMLALYVSALALTLSRSSLFALFLAVTTIIAVYLKGKGEKLWRKSMRLLGIVLLIVIVGGGVLQVLPRRAFSRYQELGRFTEATSWQGRMVKWEKNFEIWRESPWLGWGPGKANMDTVVDNEWLLILRRYGIVGLGSILLLLGSLFLGLGTIRQRRSELAVVALSVALQGTFVGYGFIMMLGTVYHSMQLMPIFLVFLGMAYSQWRPRCTRSLLL